MMNPHFNSSLLEKKYWIQIFSWNYVLYYLNWHSWYPIFMFLPWKCLIFLPGNLHEKTLARRKWQEKYIFLIYMWYIEYCRGRFYFPFIHFIWGYEDKINYLAHLLLTALRGFLLLLTIFPTLYKQVLRLSDFKCMFNMAISTTKK